MLKMDIEGLQELNGMLDGFGDALAKHILAELEDIAFSVFEESQERAPVDTGALVRSGSVNIEGDTISIEYDADYALEVHEKIEVRHSNGEAKFLEKAMDNHRGQIEEAIERAAGKALGEVS